jgi:sulfatase maturation enzyme AslB (radical SAM superfamily)
LFCATHQTVQDISFNHIAGEIDRAIEEKKGVVLTGGEPLLSEHLISVLKRIKEKNLPCVVETNGIALASKRVVNSLLPFINENLTFDILVEGSNSEMHDFLVGKKSFRQIKKAMLNLKAQNIPFYTHTVITKPNYRYLDKIAVFAQRMGTIYHRFIFPLPLGRADKNFNSMIPFISLVSSHLKKGIAVLEGRVDYHIEGLPKCILYSSVKNRYLKVLTLDNDFPVEKSAQCEKCKLREKCEGYFKWYFDRKSKDDLNPLSQ